MELGAHLPLLDLDGRGWDVGGLTAYAETARDLGYGALAANDHLVFGRPWLDGLVALSAVIEASGDLTLATTVALPVVRGPAVLAKTASAIDVLSGGRLVLGVGPGSSRLDHALAGTDFETRWSRFESAVRELRALLRGPGGPGGSGDPDGSGGRGGSGVSAAADGALPTLEPRSRDGAGPPVWIGSWGSPAGLRRAARLGDGWVASAYNTTPQQVAAGRAAHGLRCAVATMWTFVTDDDAEREARLTLLADLVHRAPGDLADRVLVGPPAACARLLRSYRDAGAELVVLWPLGDVECQLERVMSEVVPLVGDLGPP